MTPVVGGLSAPFLERNELIAEIDERHRIASAAKLEIEQATVEGQRCVDIANLESDMIESDHPCFSFRHGILLAGIFVRFPLVAGEPASCWSAPLHPRRDTPPS